MTEAGEHVRDMCPRLAGGRVVLVRSDSGMFGSGIHAWSMCSRAYWGEKSVWCGGLVEIDKIRAATESEPALLNRGGLVRGKSQALLRDRRQRTVWRWPWAGRVLLRGTLVELRHCEVGGESGEDGVA